MKRKAPVKKILLCLTALILVGAIGAGIFLTTRNSGEPVNVYAFHQIGMTEYWGDSQESSGYIQTDRVQTVYLTSTQTVTEILVSEGDTVKKGDVLMTFDTTLSDLSVERMRLDVEKLKLQLEEAKDQLARIKRMKPMVIPAPEEETEEDKGVKLTDAYQISTDIKYDGSSASKALICWIRTDTNVGNKIYQALLETAEAYQTQNALEAETESTEPADETLPEDPTEPEPIKVDKFYVVFKVTSGNMSLGSRTTWQGLQITKRNDGSFSIRFFDAASLPDHMLPKDDSAQEKPQIDFGSGFTAAQIAEMRSQQEKTIKDLEFNIKMAETEYKIMLTEVSDGKVYAEVDGVITSVLTEEEAQENGAPLLKVSGGGGFFVEGTIGELSRDTVAVGSEVTVNDWRSGMSYTGIIQSIGDYPSSNGYWSGMGNPTTTYYPFTVFVEESADFQSGSYVSITYSAGGTQSGIYLENPYLRTDGGRSYVYVMGADGKLEQRFVTTGKSLWGSYTEILDGITSEDFLAFPYGTDVKPGAPAVEADIWALYE